MKAEGLKTTSVTAKGSQPLRHDWGVLKDAGTER